MSLFKGIFWYVPDDKRLITVKVACDENGKALQHVDYSSKSGENFNHKAEWTRLPKSVTGRNPYNYYPRGRVEIKNSKATIFLHPVLDRFDIHERIEQDFGLVGTAVYVHIVADGSKHYAYSMDFQPTKCNMCGKAFDSYDYHHDLCFDKRMGNGSTHDLERVQLNLCCDCFDKTLDWLLPQCKINPISEWMSTGGETNDDLCHE